MVTVEKGREYYGLSTDVKPTDAPGNGASFLEMDTGKVFVWDAQGQLWREL